MFSLVWGSALDNLHTSTTSPLRDNHPQLGYPAPLEWVRPVGQVVRCPPLEVGLLVGNWGEYGVGSFAPLPLPFLLLWLLC